jgi:hypothetical protein
MISKKLITLTLVASLVLILVSAVLAAPETLDLSWWTVDGGGGASQGGGYTLNSTTGQPDAGILMSGEVYSLAGGYWGFGAQHRDGEKIFLPLVTR